jgi:hypothetical protein
VRDEGPAEDPEPGYGWLLTIGSGDHGRIVNLGEPGERPAEDARTGAVAAVADRVGAQKVDDGLIGTTASECVPEHEDVATAEPDDVIGVEGIADVVSREVVAEVEVLGTEPNSDSAPISRWTPFLRWSPG